MLGTIGWTGNFRFTFEVDNVGGLRVIPAINPYASDYKLKAGETFTTPEFIFYYKHKWHKSGKPQFARLGTSLPNKYGRGRPYDLA